MLLQSNPASLLPNWNFKKFEKRAIHLFQTMGTPLKEICQVKHFLGFASLRFNLIEPAPKPEQKTRHGKVPTYEPVVSTLLLEAKNRSLGVEIAPEDQDNMQIDLHTTIMESLLEGFNRFQNEAILDALDDTTLTSPLQDLSSAGFPGTEFKEQTKMFRDILTIFGNNKVPRKDRYLVVPPSFVSNALAIKELSNHDYQMLSGVQNGNINYAFGFKWIQYDDMEEKTQGTGASAFKYRNAYAVNKASIAFGIQREPVFRVDYVPEKGEHLLAGRVAVNAKTLQEKGIVRIRVRS